MEKIISEEMRFPTEQSKKKKKWMTFVCASCGETASKWYDAKMWNCKCTHCSKGGFTTDEFIAKAKEVHGETYDYSQTAYVNKRNPVSIGCKTHGLFTQKPADHTEGHGCSKCGDLVRGKLFLLDNTVWLERLSKYPLVTAKDTSQLQSYHKPVDLLCSIHGEFSVALGQIGKSKFLCPECARINHQPQSIREHLIGTEASLYYVYLPKIDMYKLGVTVQPMEARLRGLGATLLLEKKMEYTQGLKIEHALHTELKEYRYQGTKKLLSVGGSTELYKIDILYYLKRALHL